ncbi:transcription factor, RsfA family [Paenibacillus sophorae]|uniref:RsfA family transcriptional regulator n=1 Tax=Paenibacillus sophorae TaxID=1333845 RepID=A0A1H8GUZ8_9BACL|nr:hypothetical protein [Paenibacillus sophorae]QWU14352.1 RsfA family transcriptional regulator [Paenibacillus sophorae]SEN47823.1 transcription factor, RsfA family [Paenibacillus sophorae]
MTTVRQDAWSQSDDDTLAETVISHISNGRTQLEAFDQVASQLNRTQAACGFRWNSALRKNYTVEIQQAKEQRLNSKPNNRQTKRIDKSEINIDNVIDFLVSIKQIINDVKQENLSLRSKIDDLNSQLQNNHLEIPMDEVRDFARMLQKVVQMQENDKEMPTG